MQDEALQAQARIDMMKVRASVRKLQFRATVHDGE
jgi:hypothetical protein